MREREREGGWGEREGGREIEGEGGETDRQTDRDRQARRKVCSLSVGLEEFRI